jgi:hypothetical protein
LGATGKFPNEHSIIELGYQVKQAIPSFEIPSPYSDVLPLLDRYYELRYPAPSDVPGIAQGDWPVIKHIADLIEQHLPEQVRHSADTSSANKNNEAGVCRARRSES